jgi:HK97 family phage major capsid protein
MSENQKPVPSPAELMSTMVDAIKQQGEQFKSFVESQAETKSVKEEFEAKSKEIEAKAEAEIKSVKEELQAQLDEMRAKKSVNVGGATAVESYEKLHYEVKSNTIKSLTSNIDANEREVMQKQGEAYLQSFCKKHSDIAQRYDLSSIIGELSTKSISHTITDMSVLFNAPFILPAIVYAEQEMVMQRIATIYTSNSKTVAKHSFTGEGEPEWIGLQPQINPQKATVFNMKQIHAAGLAQYVTLSDLVSDAASNNMPLIMNVLQTFIKERMMKKFETAYSSAGITIGDVGGTIEGIIPTTANQYEYNFSSSLGSDQLEVGKLGFVKSGNASDVTYLSFMRLKGTLPQGTRLQIMGNSTFIDKLKLLKDPVTGRSIYYDGNGGAVINGLPERMLGFDLIVNNKMPEDIAVYGDISGSYAITNCFGGYQVFEREAVGGQLFNGLLGKMYATGQIVNYKTIRLYKIAL